MAKIGRNAPCPCGSGKKYKRCCMNKDSAFLDSELPQGKFSYESGSYGGPSSGYMPSIICYKESMPDKWDSHFCLVKPDSILDDEDAASAIAEKHISEAHATIEAGGGPKDFALVLRHEGYKSVSDFRIVNE